MKEGSIGGSAEVDLTLSGPIAAPVARGSVTVDGVSVRVRALPQAVTGIRGRVDLDGSTATLAATGNLGGGDLRLEGEARTADAGLGDLWLQLTGRGVALRYPPGLRSRLDVDLTLAGRPGDMVLAGNVAVNGGVYEIDVAMREALRGAGAGRPPRRTFCGTWAWTSPSISRARSRFRATSGDSRPPGGSPPGETWWSRRPSGGWTCVAGAVSTCRGGS